jgi:hypothetical protein
MCQQKLYVVTYMLTLLLTLNLKTWALGLQIMNDHQLFFAFFFSYVPIWVSIVYHYLCQCQI